MLDRRSVEEIDRTTRERVGGWSLDFAATDAVTSLYRASNAARNHLTSTVLSPHDLTWTGFLVLWLLWRHGSVETRHVAEDVGISKATLTGVTKTLLARGLIEREPSTVDRRLVELRLTEAGERLMDRLYPAYNVAETQLVAGLRRREVERLTEALRHVVTCAEDYVEE